MKTIWTRLGASLLFALTLDGVTKIWAEQTLARYQPVPLFDDFFRLTLGYNTGVAFGLFANGGIWPLVVTGAIIGLLLVWFGHSLYTGHFPPSAAWAVGLLLGGAIGNFVDRLPDGRVTDFIDVGWGAIRWPTFNLADSFILIGVGLLVLLTYDEPAQETEPQLESAAPENNADHLINGNI